MVPKEKRYTPPITRETLDILVHNICKKTQLPETVVRELYRGGWRYHEARGQIMWIK